MDQRTDGPGVSRIDPSDPAAPLYRLLAKMRSPVSLRDMMIIPVRTGYIGQQKAMDPADLPKSAAELYPDIKVSELDVPSPAGRIRCQLFASPAAEQLRPMLLARPSPLNINLGSDRFSMFNKKRDVPKIHVPVNESAYVRDELRLAPIYPALTGSSTTSFLIRDLAPLGSLKNLQTLDCSFTQVTDLAPLGSLVNLQTLDCSSTQVTDLAPLGSLET